MTTETRDFPTLVIASLSSGVLLVERGFSAIHEAAEYLMGHPIWTHHFANKELWHEMQRTVLEQCPGMPTDIPEGKWREEGARLEKEFGPTVNIRKGAGLTAMLPTDGIPDHLKDETIFVKT